MFCKLCLEGYDLVKLLSGKQMALEVEANRRERSGPS